MVLKVLAIVNFGEIGWLLGIFLFFFFSFFSCLQIPAARKISLFLLQWISFIFYVGFFIIFYSRIIGHLYLFRIIQWDPFFLDVDSIIYFILLGLPHILVDGDGEDNFFEYL